MFIPLWQRSYSTQHSSRVGGISTSSTRCVGTCGSGSATSNNTTGRSRSSDRLCDHVTNSTIGADTQVVELVRVHGTRRSTATDREWHPRRVCSQVPCLRQGATLQGT